MVDPKLEEVKTVAIWKTYTRKTLQQSYGSWDESVQMELPSYQRNLKGMAMIRSSIRGMADFSTESHNWWNQGLQIVRRFVMEIARGV